MTSPQMTCPKCHGAMRSYERAGVTVDQCTECRGIFLDRGELEHLIDAEARWTQPAQPPAAPPPPTPQQAPPVVPVYETYDPHYSSSGYAQPAYGYGHKRRRKHFLEELFD